MTKEEYEIRLTALQRDFNDKKDALMRECAISNNPFKSGDKITDGTYTIIIKSANISCFGGSMPTLYYSGIWLKKDGTPNKRNESATIYQSRATKID